MLETIAKKIVEFYVRSGAVPDDEDHRELYQYGVEIFLSSAGNLLIIALLGLLFGSLTASVLFLLVFLLIRRHSGGYHADTYLRCNVVFGCVFLAVLLLAKLCAHIPFLCIPLAVLTASGIIVVWKYAPVPNPHKTLNDRQKRNAHRFAILGYTLTTLAGIALAWYDDFLGAVVLGTLTAIVVLMVVGHCSVVRNA